LKKAKEAVVTEDLEQGQVFTVDSSPVASESMTDQSITNVEKQAPLEPVTHPSVVPVEEHDPVDGSSVSTESDQ
jgi:hypothetical protein